MHLMSSFFDLSYVQLEADHFKISFASSTTCTARTSSKKKKSRLYMVRADENNTHLIFLQNHLYLWMFFRRSFFAHVSDVAQI